MALMVLALAVDARGQRLLETDGVELRGEAQLVMSRGRHVQRAGNRIPRTRRTKRMMARRWTSGAWDFSVRNGSAGGSIT